MSDKLTEHIDAIEEILDNARDYDEAHAWLDKVGATGSKKNRLVWRIKSWARARRIPVDGEEMRDE